MGRFRGDPTGSDVTYNNEIAGLEAISSSQIVEAELATAAAPSSTRLERPLGTSLLGQAQWVK